MEGAPLACPAGCGEFVSREALVEDWDMISRGRVALSWPQGAAPCPLCQRDMHVAFREELRFDRCDAHGVWLDAGERERFEELFRSRVRRPPDDSAERVARLVKLLEFAAQGDRARRVSRAVRDAPDFVTAVIHHEARNSTDLHALEIVAGADRLVVRVSDWERPLETLRRRCPQATFQTVRDIDGPTE
jgi:Zn-finger nucleic acid-binding protein